MKNQGQPASILSSFRPYGPIFCAAAPLSHSRSLVFLFLFDFYGAVDNYINE